MRRALSITGALLALTASAASAAGFIQLGWGDCATAGASTLNLNNTCTSNAGIVGMLVGSFEAPLPIGQLIGTWNIIDLQTEQATLSPWWHMEIGGCRANSISSSYDFLAGPFGPCVDLWEGRSATGGQNYSIASASRAHYQTTSFLLLPLTLAIGPGTEYYLMRVTINNAKSVGAGSCSGCSDRACFVFNSCELLQPASLATYKLTSGPQQAVSYQGGIPGGDCLAATPTRKTAWGTIKALYR